MCLGIPVRLEKVEGNTGLVDLGGLRREIGLDLTPTARPGDYVLLHAGFAVQIIDQKSAGETLALLREMYGQDKSQT